MDLEAALAEEATLEARLDDVRRRRRDLENERLWSVVSYPMALLFGWMPHVTLLVLLLVVSVTRNGDVLYVGGGVIVLVALVSLAWAVTQYGALRSALPSAVNRLSLEWVLSDAVFLGLGLILMTM
jgi:hypothetical protein